MAKSIKNDDVANVVLVNEDAPTQIQISTFGLQGPLGPTGPVGDTAIEIGTAPPSNTDVLWADTTESPRTVGPTGPTGPTGAGVPTGGESYDILQKRSANDFDTEWTASPTVTSFRVGEGDSFFQTTLITAFTEDTEDITLDVTTADSVKYMVRVSDSENAMTTEIIATALGPTVNFTEYGKVMVGLAPCSFDVSRDDNLIFLICTPTTDTLTQYRVVKHAITG